jgi:hypothetical protein
MPESLKRRGLLGAEVAVEGNRFISRFYYSASWYNHYDARVIGTVGTHAEGSVVRATCRVGNLIWVPTGLLAIVNFYRLLRDGTVTGSGLLLTSLLCAFAARVYFWRSQQESRHLLFLMSRLDASLADVEVRRKQYARTLR